MSKYEDRNDHEYKVGPGLPAHMTGGFVSGEQRIRRMARELVAGELEYTTRGNRGAGKTRESILIRIRHARQDHTASIRREHEWVTRQ